MVRVVDLVHRLGGAVDLFLAVALLPIYLGLVLWFPLLLWPLVEAHLSERVAWFVLDCLKWALLFGVCLVLALVVQFLLGLG